MEVAVFPQPKRAGQITFNPLNSFVAVDGFELSDFGYEPALKETYNRLTSGSHNIPIFTFGDASSALEAARRSRETAEKPSSPRALRL